MASVAIPIATSVIGNLIAGIVGSGASEKAAKIQADAAKYAADISGKGTRDSLALQKDIFEQQRGDQGTSLAAGQAGLTKLADLLGIPLQIPTRTQVPGTGTAAQPIAYADWRTTQQIPTFEEHWAEVLKTDPYLSNPNMDPAVLASIKQVAANAYGEWSEEQLQAQYNEYKDSGQLPMPEYQTTYATAPTSAEFGTLAKPWEYSGGKFNFDSADLMKDPSYLFRLKEGQKAIERSAAARGGALGGGTLADLMRYGQDYASTEFGSAYSRAAGEYDRDFANEFNVAETNRVNRINPLLSLAGLGQTAANTVGAAGSNYAANAGNTIAGGSRTLADLITQGANSQAAGVMGGANIWGKGLGNIGNNVTSLYAR